MDAVSLHPAAGAQGELLGIKLDPRLPRGEAATQKTTVLIPDSAHGTNPATVRMVGYDVERGRLRARRPARPRRACGGGSTPTRAGIMVTNPNTVGLFETEIPGDGRA